MRLLEGSGQDGVSESILQAFAPMKTLNQIDEQTLPLMESLEQFQVINDQLLSDLKDYAQGLAFDPQEANEINGKKDIYDEIKKTTLQTIQIR